MSADVSHRCHHLLPAVPGFDELQPSVIVDSGNARQSDTTVGSGSANMVGKRTISNGTELHLPHPSDIPAWMTNGGSDHSAE